jgi:hypothetical protein
MSNPLIIIDVVGMRSLHKEFWFEPLCKMLISNLPKLDDTCISLPHAHLFVRTMYHSGLMRAF